MTLEAVKIAETDSYSIRFILADSPGSGNHNKFTEEVYSFCIRLIRQFNDKQWATLSIHLVACQLLKYENNNAAAINFIRVAKCNRAKHINFLIDKIDRSRKYATGIIYTKLIGYWMRCRRGRQAHALDQ